MQTYVAFLRGINVGGNSKVDMTTLKKVFVSLGFQNISSYINSGNVIFKEKNKTPFEIIKIIEDKLKIIFAT
jgi:uncharacterized protein (DUF1697 family)